VPKTDLWQTSATRVEVDQRSREALLQLERGQRLLVLRTQSWLSRMRYRFGLRLFGCGANAKSIGASDGARQARVIATEVGPVAKAVWGPRSPGRETFYTPARPAERPETSLESGRKARRIFLALTNN
jgi:hypothetical protein